MTSRNEINQTALKNHQLRNEYSATLPIAKNLIMYLILDGYGTPKNKISQISPQRYNSSTNKKNIFAKKTKNNYKFFKKSTPPSIQTIF
jgi:hypothetical protein